MKIVLNGTHLQRQLKVVDQERQELQKQLDKVDRVREALLTLIEMTDAENPARAAAPASVPVEGENSENSKLEIPEDLSGKISEILGQSAPGMNADEIFDSLRDQGYPLKGRRPVSAVYRTLEKHPELFMQSDNGNWVVVSAG